MGNILPQTAITYAIGCSGEDTIDRGLTNEGGLGAAHTRGCGVLRGIHGIRAGLGALCGAAACPQPVPAPSRSSLPQMPFLPGPLCPMNF